MNIRRIDTIGTTYVLYVYDVKKNGDLMNTYGDRSAKKLQTSFRVVNQQRRVALSPDFTSTIPGRAL